MRVSLPELKVTTTAIVGWVGIGSLAHMRECPLCDRFRNMIPKSELITSESP